MFNKGGRHYWFAKYLQKEGYSPIIFAANSRHGIAEQWIAGDKLWIEMKDDDLNIPFIFIQVRLYSTNGKQRIFNMVDFYRNVKKAAKQYAAQYGKPDIIYASSVHPLTLVAGIQLAKYFGVKCICEARDLWPEAIFAYSKRITKDSLLGKILYRGERWIYKRADALIFTQEGGPDYIRSHGWDNENGGPIDMSKAYHINNGVDLEAFDQNKNDYWLQDFDMDNPDTIKVIYTGVIRRINNLGLIVDAAKLVKNPKIKFIIFGNGDEKEKLQKRLIDEGINNVVFKGAVDKKYIPSIDVRSDINIVHWEMTPLLRVGESYNKSFEYYAAGKPVFYTVRPGYSIVEKYHCGKLTEGFTPADIAKGLEDMVAMSDEEKQVMARNARKVAEIYDFKNLTKNLIDIIENS